MDRQRSIFLDMIKHWTFKHSILASALLITLCAAFFSVTGIGKLFAGAAVSAIVMASALELGKIVSISFLYRYWTELGKTLKGYLLVASVVLMLITSAGIYGYLSAAYAKVAADPLAKSATYSLLEAQQATIAEQITQQQARITQLSTLRAQQENRLDTLITKSQLGSTSVIRSLQAQLTQQDREVSQLRTAITTLNKQRDSIAELAMRTQLSITSDSKIGTFVYISRMLNVPLDTVVKWFILIIVLVFDPLAVALIIAYNFIDKRQSQISISSVDNDRITDIKQLSEESPAVNIPASAPATSPDSGPAPRRDPQYFARGDFDWDKRDQWESDPNAVRYYEAKIKNR